MLYTETTKYGSICYDKNIIGNIAKKTIESLGRNVIASDSKGRMRKVANAPGSEDMNFIEISSREDSIDIRIYLILRFGTSIRETAEKLGSMLRENIDEVLGVRPGKVTVVFTGVISKQLSKRYIEVETDDIR